MYRSLIISSTISPVPAPIVSTLITRKISPSKRARRTRGAPRAMSTTIEIAATRRDVSATIAIAATMAVGTTVAIAATRRGVGTTIAIAATRRAG